MMFAHLPPDRLMIVCFLGLLAWAAFRDAVSFRIPNGVSLSILALYPLHVAASPLPLDWVAALVTAAAVLAVGLMIFLGGLAGGGDVKLLSASALWAGSGLIFPLLMLMSFAGGALALAAWSARTSLRRRRRVTSGGTLSHTSSEEPIHLPYGIAIAFGGGFIGLRLLLG
jgi:prepilin peptidase CpaA